LFTAHTLFNAADSLLCDSEDMAGIPSIVATGFSLLYVLYSQHRHYGNLPKIEAFYSLVALVVAVLAGTHPLETDIEILFFGE
jgi:hypothetical protein